MSPGLSLGHDKGRFAPRSQAAGDAVGGIDLLIEIDAAVSGELNQRLAVSRDGIVGIGTRRPRVNLNNFGRNPMLLIMRFVTIVS